MLQWGRRRSRRINVVIGRLIDRKPQSFNGAADDLGGSTLPAADVLAAAQPLQWGRRRSRRINFAASLANCVCALLQWGRRRSRRINAPYVEPARNDCRASMGPPTISADQRQRCSCVSIIWNTLQWGRRRSRRINPAPSARVTRTPRASMGPPTISADQRYPPEPAPGAASWA